MDDYKDLETLAFDEIKIENTNFLLKIMKVFTNPSEAFKVIKDHGNIMAIYFTYILISCITIFIQYSSGSMKEDLIKQFAQQGTEITDQLIKVSLISGAVVGIIAVILIPVLAAFVYHIVCMIMGRTGYKKTLSVILYSMLIPISGGLIILIINIITGQSITFTPLMFLDTESMSTVMVSLVSLIDIFSIWYMIVVFIGLKLVHELSKKEALIVLFAPFILKVGVVVITSVIAESFLQIV